MKFTPGVTDEGTVDVDNLIAGSHPIVGESATILLGAGNLVRGTVLGKITASGKLTPVDSAAVDGSEDPYAVLAEDTDASAADQVAAVYLCGEFNENALVFGGADTVATHKAAMRALAMYAKASVEA